MTEIPKIEQYTGAVPDKAIMDKDTFANSVHGYLNYFNDTFVPDSQNFTDSMNVLQEELQNFQSDTNDLVNQADSIKTDIYNYKNEAQQAVTDAQNYQTLAKNYANADEDTQVESGYYSAKHYMLKTQEVMANAVAQLPEGTIDDSAVGDNVAWSSSKISDELKKQASAGNIDGGNANTAIDTYIDGGDATNS
jgi:hypothetical protein